MITINDISILIVSAVNDIARLVSVYEHLRAQYPENEIVVVYDNIQNKLLNEKDHNLIQITTNSRVYVSMGYNLAIKHCSKPYFVFLHDDTYTAPNFLENLIPHLTERVFCNFVTVEPPLFGNPDTIQKPIRNFGTSSESFDKNAFNSFYFNHIKNLPHVEEASPFGGFFMAGFVNSFKSVKGFDESFKPYFYEDSDLMVRLHLAGYKFKLILNSIVYHIGSLTSRTSSDSLHAHNTTQKIFLKKWKTTFEYYKLFSMFHGIEYSYPNLRIDSKNCNEQIKEYLELFNDPTGINLLQIDGSKLTQEDLELLAQIPYIIKSTDKNCEYEIGNLILKTNKQ